MEADETVPWRYTFECLVCEQQRWPGLTAAFWEVTAAGCYAAVHVDVILTPVTSELDPVRSL